MCYEAFGATSFIYSLWRDGARLQSGGRGNIERLLISDESYPETNTLVVSIQLNYP